MSQGGCETSFPKGLDPEETWLSFSFRVPQGRGQKLRLNRLEEPLPRLVETEAQRALDVWSRPHRVGGKASSGSSLSCSPRPLSQAPLVGEAGGGEVERNSNLEEVSREARTSSSHFCLFLAPAAPGTYTGT